MAGKPLDTILANILSPTPSISLTWSYATPLESPNLDIYYTNICIFLLLELAHAHTPKNRGLLYIPAISVCSGTGVGLWGRGLGLFIPWGEFRDLIGVLSNLKMQ